MLQICQIPVRFWLSKSTRHINANDYAIRLRFTTVLGDEAQVVVDATKILQNHLGDVNEAQLAIEIIRAYEKQVKKSQRPNLKVYRKSRKDEVKHLCSTFPDVWSHFTKRGIQQALQATIANL